MNIKLKKKEVLENFQNVICVGYCDIQHLLRGKERIGYTSGVYGWNADIYNIDNKTAICTGYRPFGNISTHYNINKKYDDKARKICKNWDLTWEQTEKKLNKLLQKYVDEVLKESEVK